MWLENMCQISQATSFKIAMDNRTQNGMAFQYKIKHTKLHLLDLTFETDYHDPTPKLCQYRQDLLCLKII